MHLAEVRPFGHANYGFEPDELAEMIRSAGLAVEHCAAVAREKRTPHFEVVAATATHPRDRPELP